MSKSRVLIYKRIEPVHRREISQNVNLTLILRVRDDGTSAALPTTTTSGVART